MTLGNDDLSLSVKALEQETWEQVKHRAEQIINTVQLQADFFEMHARIKPTIFMSYDLFAIIAAGLQDAIVQRFDENHLVHTICGYDLELLHLGKELLYVGYKVNMSF